MTGEYPVIGIMSLNYPLLVPLVPREKVPCPPIFLKLFNTEQMSQAVFAFRRYEDAWLQYTGIESHEGLTHYGLWGTVVARE